MREGRESLSEGEFREGWRGGKRWETVKDNEMRSREPPFLAGVIRSGLREIVTSDREVFSASGTTEPSTCLAARATWSTSST